MQYKPKSVESDRESPEIKGENSSHEESFERNKIEEDISQCDDDQEKEKPGLIKKKLKRSKKTKKTLLQEFFDDEAEEDDESDSGQDEGSNRKQLQPQISQLPKRKQECKWIKELDGKKEEDVEKFFMQRKYREVSNLNSSVPTKSDPIMLLVKVKRGTELLLILSMLRSCREQMRSNDTLTCQIVSAFCRPNKFPGYIFMESFQENTARHFLKGFMGIRHSTLEKISTDQYSSIFKKVQKPIETLKKSSFVRILTGLYEGDLAKVCEVKKTCIKVAVAPRVNQQMLKVELKKKEEDNFTSSVVLKSQSMVLEHKKSIPTTSRPPKKLISDEEVFHLLQNKFGQTLTQQGHLIIKLARSEINEDIGALFPKQTSFFHQSEQGILDFMQRQQRNFNRNNLIRVGQLVASIAGQTIGLTGVVKRVEGGLAVFDAFKNGRLMGEIKQPIHKLSLVFNEGDQVVVTNGTDKGKEGIVLAVQGQKTVILTRNDNQIRVLTSMLVQKNGINSIPSNPPIMEFKKYDLLRFNGEVGVVISWNTEFVKIVNQSNHFRVINPVQVDEIVRSRLNFTINCHNEKINYESTVMIMVGDRSIRVCEVKHVFRETVFVYNSCFFESEGIRAQKVNNCRLQSVGWDLGKAKRTDPKMLGQFQTGKNTKILTGFHKGYVGTVIKVVGDLVRLKLMANGKVVELPFSCFGIQDTPVERARRAPQTPSIASPQRKSEFECEMDSQLEVLSTPKAKRQ